MNKIYYVFLGLSITFFCSCKKDNSEPKGNITITPKEATIFSGDTKQLDVSYSAENLKTKSFQWMSRDLNVAKVSQSGLVTGVRVGIGYVRLISTDGDLKDSTKITVLAKYDLYKEPHLTLGSTQSQVKEYETRILTSQTSTGLIYSGEVLAVRNVIYSFDGGVMTSVAVLLANNTTVAQLAPLFLNERYEFTATSSGIYFFRNNKGMAVGLSVDATLGLCVIYFTDPNYKSTHSMIDNFYKALETNKNNMKL